MSTATQRATAAPELVELPRRLPAARWRGPVVNERPGGMLRPYLGLVLHVECGTETGTGSWFRNPAAQCSAHLGYPKSGGRDQWVEIGDRAWAEAAGNARWLSAETEGEPAEPLTGAQVDALAADYATLHRLSPREFPMRTTDDPSSPGFGWHGMGGVAWGGHPGCPGELRKAQRVDVLAAAVRLLRPDVATPHGHEPAPAPAYPGHVLALGVVDEAVAVWQRRMRARGWRLAVTGRYGLPDVGVCAEFQAEKGLRVDGMVGPVTWAASWHARIT